MGKCFKKKVINLPDSYEIRLCMNPEEKIGDSLFFYFADRLYIEKMKAGALK